MKYLKHPLKDFIQISEGWIYSKEERKVHHNYFHCGIDYQTHYSHPVYASADGYAVASYHRFPLNDLTGFPILKDGMPVSNGLGLFIQIYHPEKISHIKGGTITQYGHLSRLENPSLLKRLPPIKYDIASRIVRRNERKRKHKLSISDIELKLNELKEIEIRFPWINKAYGYNFTKDVENKESYIYTPAELEQLISSNSPYVMKVKQGQLIGYTGLSGVFFGVPPYDEDTFNIVPDFKNTWDEIHLHFEVAQRDWQTGAKIKQLDPYKIYKSKKWYQNNPKSIFIDN